jgi:predicted kinase
MAPRPNATNRQSLQRIARRLRDTARVLDLARRELLARDILMNAQVGDKAILDEIEEKLKTVTDASDEIEILWIDFHMSVEHNKADEATKNESMGPNGPR